MTVKFKDIVESTINEDFKDFVGRHVVSDLDDSTSGNKLGSYIRGEDKLKVAEAALHPNATGYQLEKALDHGGMDHIVAAHPNTEHRALKRILSKSTDEFARMAASHNRNMTPSALANAYSKEKSPHVKAEMLRSMHMPTEILNAVGSAELEKAHPSKYTLDSIVANLAAPTDMVDKINKRNQETGYKAGANGRLLQKAARVIDGHGIAPGTTEDNGVTTSHFGNADHGVIRIHVTHHFNGNPVSAFNTKRKDFDAAHSKIDEIVQDPYIQQHFDTSVDKVSFGKAMQEAKAYKASGEDKSIPQRLTSSLKLALKPEHQTTEQQTTSNVEHGPVFGKGVEEPTEVKLAPVYSTPVLSHNDWDASVDTQLSKLGGIWNNRHIYN